MLHQQKVSSEIKKAKELLYMGLLFESEEDYWGAYTTYCYGIAFNTSENKTNYFLHNNAAYCLNMLLNFRDAEYMSLIAISINDTYHNSFKNLGFAFVGQGKYSDAVIPLLTANSICQEDLRSLKILARLERNFPNLNDLFPNLREEIASSIEKASKITNLHF